MTATTGPIAKRSFDRRAADWLRDAIIGGQLAPGERLTETGLSAEVGVSRSTTRTALLHLAAEGLVVQQAYSGWSVAELSADDAWELYTLRGSLDRLAAQLTAERINDVRRDALKEAYQRLVDAIRDGDRRSTAEADIDFHLEIARLSGHRRLLGQYALIRGAALLYVMSTNRRAQVDRMLGEHGDIMNAINSGDVERAQILAEQHVRAAGGELQFELSAGHP